MFSPTSYMEMVAYPLLNLLCCFAVIGSAIAYLHLVVSVLLFQFPFLPYSQFQEQKTKNHHNLHPEDVCEEKKDNCHHSRRIVPMLDQDLNCLPHPIATPELSENQHTDQGVPEIVVKKKKRAATEHVAKIALADLAKYFDLPIAEASRNLKVGLTVLKRKCREFGIPRWPHRKIKSLDTLIHDLQKDLQEEAERQQQENKAAAMAVAKRQRMLEKEKECIERKPFMEIQSETKKFRQDVFKRRHRARALNIKC
ncbi:hypothetical protein HHK36_010453 [Tetracentron sinense]|uniref:RWP-RK domain-containing protein n=1 Tax=Tetracentron sinense TaxID=13715 RepID=A0A834ZKU2_TETSI|nr:hypothetical protein HHK36_010453 [Tetracentron sinense]